MPTIQSRWLRLLCTVLLMCMASSPAPAAEPTQLHLLDLFPAPPALVDRERAYFAVAGEYPSYTEASEGLATLRRNAPQVRFLLFPPYGEWRSWAVMAAAYESKDKANFAVHYLFDHKLSAGPYLRSVEDMAGQPIQWVPEPESQRGKIIGCLGQGAATISAMYACAGVLVTPESLVRCISGGLCTLDLNPVNLADYLRAHQLGMDSLLIAAPGGTLSPQLIKTCLARSRQASAAVDCMLLAKAGGAIDPACLGLKGEAALACMVGKKLDPGATAAYDCVRQAAGAAQVLQCAAGNDAATVLKLQQCLSRPGSLANLVAACAPGATTADQKTVIECISTLGARKSRPQDCLRSRSDWAAPLAMGQCLQRAKADVGTILACAKDGGVTVPPQAAACVKAMAAGKPLECATTASGDPVVRCVTGHRGNPDDLWMCLARTNPAAENAVTAYRCLSSGNRTAELLATCASPFLPPETRQAATCLARAGGDAKASAVCVASQYMGKEEARLLNCAATAQGYAGFGICALGPQMNQEWRIAAECVAAGGPPPVMAGCVAGRLTIAELEKCFSKGIGGDGCFGENNTLVVGFRNAANDIAHGPGPNNDIVKGIQAVGDAFDSLF